MKMHQNSSVCPERIRQRGYPNLVILMQLLGTVGVASCECVRSISALRRLETYMRTTMGQERINGLALMHVHFGVDNRYSMDD